MTWICCQIGAREHYAIPRALHQAGQLATLITDSWLPARSPLRLLPRSLSTGLPDRFHPDLAHAPVQAFTLTGLFFELNQRLHRRSPWDRMMQRNQWFQANAIDHLRSLSFSPQNPPILFTYSYAARDLLTFARERGWKTVLGQIDPGPEEDAIVQQVCARYPHLSLPHQSPPPIYWEQWREECELADRIIVNSPWSAQLLQRAGIPESKLSLIPLVYEPDPEASHYQRVYPTQFSADRPLRVLFLGQVNLRKGMGEILEAIELLEHEPIEWWIVGPVQIRVPDRFQSHPKIRWLGTIPRSQVKQYYQQADIFLLPTHSDGFALTQLEAQAWKLPLITSIHCAPIVQERFNGFKLEVLTSRSICERIKGCLKSGNMLEKYSNNSQTFSYQFSSTCTSLSNALKQIIF